MWRERESADHGMDVYGRYRNDVPVCRVISDDCRVRGEDFGVGEVCAHVRVQRMTVRMLYLIIINLEVYGGSK